MVDVWYDFEMETIMLPLQGDIFDNQSTTTQDDAYLDSKENGLWGHCLTRRIFDVKIFNLPAKPSKTLSDP